MVVQQRHIIGGIGCAVFLLAGYAAFAQTMFMPATLSVSRSGTGGGSVSGSGISCPTMCSAMVMMGTPVTLTAAPEAGSVFTGWSGDCSGASVTCTFSPGANANVTAQFDLSSGSGSSSSGTGSAGTSSGGSGGSTSDTPPSVPPAYVYSQDVYILKGGTGSGRVSGGSISCGATCYALVDFGTKFVFSAEPDDNSVFAGWSGSCSGVPKDKDCSVTADKQTVITANFNVVTPQKTVLGIPTVGYGLGIKKLPFTGDALGPSWRVGGTTANPIAQGTLTGRGSVTSIGIGLYTGSVNAQFNGKGSKWTSAYYSEGAAQRAELFDATKGLYQEDMTADDDGTQRVVALLFDGKAVFGTYDGGSFLIVPRGTVPAVPSGSWTDIAVPRGNNGPLIPTQKIMDLLSKAALAVQGAFVSVARAAGQGAALQRAFDAVTAYRRVTADMLSIQQKFSAFNFNDPNVDYVAAQALVDAYEADQLKLDGLAAQMGIVALFVRTGDWFTAGGPAADDLAAAQVDAVPAALASGLSGPFDMYAVQSAGGRQAVFSIACDGRNNAATGEQVSCSARAASGAQAKAARAASDAYSVLVAQAHDALGKIESALFAAAE